VHKLNCNKGSCCSHEKPKNEINDNNELNALSEQYDLAYEKRFNDKCFRCERDCW